MSTYKEFIPTGKAVSKAQWHFFNRCLEECPPDQPERRAALMAALNVDYARLPDKASSSPKSKAPTAATPKPQADLPIALKPTEWGTVSTVLSAYRMSLSPEQKQAVFNLGYFVNAPGMGFMALVQTPQKRERLRQLFPSLRTVWTFKEVRSFLELGDEKVKSLRQAVELLASPAPPEATLPAPMEKPVKGGWVDTDEGENWSFA
jgi:hypothetical protein